MLFETDGVNMLVKEPFEWITNLGSKTSSPNGPQTPLHCKLHSKRPQPSSEARAFAIGQNPGVQSDFAHVGRKATIDRCRRRISGRRNWARTNFLRNRQDF